MSPVLLICLVFFDLVLLLLFVSFFFFVYLFSFVLFFFLMMVACVCRAQLIMIRALHYHPAKVMDVRVPFKQSFPLRLLKLYIIFHCIGLLPFFVRYWTPYSGLNKIRIWSDWVGFTIPEQDPISANHQYHKFILHLEFSPKIRDLTSQ